MSYYDNVNPTLFEQVTAQMKHLGELGCGAGQFARAVRETYAPERYVGVDVAQGPLAAAAPWLDQSICADLNRVDDWSEHPQLRTLQDGSFDCWVVGDVLEHLVEPERALAGIHRSLKPSGTLLACIPNVRNWEVMLQLLKGSWPRQEAGIFDRTHLRWFTRTDMIQMIAKAGFAIDKVVYRKLADDRIVEFLEFFEPVCDYLGTSYDEFMDEAQVVQYVIVARKTAAGT